MGRGFAMANKEPLNKEDFLRFAKHAGLDVDSPHMDDLHAYLKGLLPILKTLKDLDLAGLEPFMPSLTKKE
jgi:hypothetical protein